MKICYGILLTLMLTALGACSTTHMTAVPEHGEVLVTWQRARDYQAQGRYELAKQQYTLALAASRVPESQATLERELAALDRMMQAMR